MLKYHQIDRTLLEHCYIRQYSKKAVIIEAGSISSHLFYIINGSVTVSAKSPNNKDVTLAYLEPGEYFGELCLFDGNSRRSAGVHARTKCKIASISYKKLRALEDILPKLLFNIASQIALRLRKTTDKVVDLAFTDVQGRIAKILLELSKKPDAVKCKEGTQIKVIRKELANIVGCSRETVGRILKALEENHIISIKGRTVTIIDKRT